MVQRLPADVRAWFYRSHQGAEIDLLIDRGGRTQIAIEVKRSSAPSPDKGFAQACDDLGVAQRWLFYPGAERYLSLLTLRRNLVPSSAPQCMKWPSCNCLLGRCSCKTSRPVAHALLLGDRPHLFHVEPPKNICYRPRCWTLLLAIAQTAKWKGIAPFLGPPPIESAVRLRT